jgi:hypothetical protein
MPCGRRSARIPARGRKFLIPRGDYGGCSGILPPPTPPGEKAAAREDQVRRSRTPGTHASKGASGQLANISGSGGVTSVAGSPTRWLGAGGQGNFSITGNTFTLEAIGGGQPSQLLLPSGTSFPNANASITGGQFNPFVVGPETFTLNLSGLLTGEGQHACKLVGD